MNQRIRYLVEQGGLYPYPDCRPRRTEVICRIALAVALLANALIFLLR